MDIPDVRGSEYDPVFSAREPSAARLRRAERNRAARADERGERLWDQIMASLQAYRDTMTWEDE